MEREQKMLREIFAFIWYLLLKVIWINSSFVFFFEEDIKKIFPSRILTRWEMHIFLIRKKFNAFAYDFLFHLHSNKEHTK